MPSQLATDQAPVGQADAIVSTTGSTRKSGSARNAHHHFVSTIVRVDKGVARSTTGRHTPASAATWSAIRSRTPAQASAPLTPLTLDVTTRTAGFTQRTSVRITA